MVAEDAPLRIALLSYRGKPHVGGQGVYIRHLSKALVDLGHHVEVLSGQPYPMLDERVPLVELPSLDIYNDYFPMRMPGLWELKSLGDWVEVTAFSGGTFPEPLAFSVRAWQYLKDRVVDSREGRGGDTIRRRRECLACRKRFTSYERIEDIPFMVVKRDGKREIFDGNKLLAGLIKSVEKRPVSMTELEDVVSDVVSLLHDANNRELEAERIGEVVMAALRDLDQVAYVRFASVYRRFEDVSEFMEELKGLVERKSRKTGDRGPA